MQNVFKFDIEGVHTTYLPTGKYSCCTNTIFKKRKTKLGKINAEHVYRGHF